MSTPTTEAARISAAIASIGQNPPPSRYYAESDGEPHARTHYVCHTHGRPRIDCRNAAEALDMAHRLNAAQSSAMGKWNAQADQFNQWVDLGGEERRELIAAEMESFAALVEVVKLSRSNVGSMVHHLPLNADPTERKEPREMAWRAERGTS